jgi:beta propeller repeat protein
MKNKEKLYSIALASTSLVFVFLILISAAASAAQVTKIGTGYDPAIHGNEVVWTNGVVINLYNLTDGTDTTVSSSGASSPDIYDSKLVWLDESRGTPGLAVYDIPTATKSYITQNVDQYSEPSIYGDRIVWSANDSVYLMNMSTSTQTKIGNGSNPDIYDTKVVYYSYSEDPEADIAIRMYDINTGERITVGSYGDPNIPRIWDTKVIWSDVYNHQGYVVMYDILTGNITDVTNPLDTDPDGNEYGASTGTHIAIHNDKIVYNKVVDDYEGKPGVYVYNITTGQSRLIYGYLEDVYTTPEVYNNTVVWGMNRNYIDGSENNNIYLYNFSEQPENLQ